MVKTFAYQTALPALPIPALEDTMSKLLEWVQPIVSEEQFQETTRVVQAFFGESGESEKLQQQLVAWDEKAEGSWLKTFWDDQALTYRGSLPTDLNFSVLLTNEQYENRYTRSELAGKVSYLVTQLYHLIIDEEIEPETIRGTPLCMSQYKNFFKSVRIPHVGKDAYIVGELDKKNNHIVMLYKNNAYKIHVTDQNGHMYPSKEIGAAIETILLTEEAEGDGVGIFTATGRDKATEVYDALKLSTVNAESLQAIADSLIVLSIDEESGDAKEAIENLLSNGRNKYFDKTIQAIITTSGEVAFDFEHTGIDGTTSFAIMAHVNDGLKKDDVEDVSTAHSLSAQKLDWEISKEMKEILHQLQLENAQTQKEYSIDLRPFTDFGSDKIKELKISPDAFFHIALQIAQYRTFGKIRSTYESISVRHFNEGRTECARATSKEKLELIMALERGEQNKETLYKLIQQAGDAHSNRLRVCQQGHGVERHMYGLQQMHQLYGAELGMNELPSIFSDEGYLALRHDFISTSGMANDNIKYCIFGPVVADGFGIFYVILNDKITINLSSKAKDEENARRLTDHLVKAFRELREIAESNL